MGKGKKVLGIGDSGPLIDLDMALERHAEIDTEQAAVAGAVKAIAAAAIELEVLVAKGMLSAALTEDRRGRRLDAASEKIMMSALELAGVAVISSDRGALREGRDAAAPIAVAIDPLDGLSNVDVNVPIGTIFSILPMTEDPKEALLQSGDRQLAAGFVIYGPQTCLALTCGDGADIYTLDRQDRAFIRTNAAVRIPADSVEYAIEASNYRHWDAPIQAYVDDNVTGDDRPRGKNFNMRWIGSLVAEAYRILIRGGIYLHPGDRRPGCEKGRLRLIHEANPIAMLIEQAGGLAIDGEDRILAIEPRDHDQRVPLIFGSNDRVERVRAFHDGTLPLGERSPLFGRRGLFRH